MNMKKLRIPKNVPDVMECYLEHEVDLDKTRAFIDFLVPIAPEEWHKILAFFKWGNTKHKAEQHVRLFVNGKEKIWKAWAFPQKSASSMTAKEIEDHPRFKEQRALFPDPDWHWFGTVHHHCNGDAFQSSTDRSDEESKDGFHVTIGSLEKDEYTLDSRVYIDGIKFITDLLWFWEIGEGRKEIPKFLRNKITDGEIAKMQMCQPAPEGTTFPKAWEENIIVEPPKEIQTYHSRNVGWTSNGYCDNKVPYLETAKSNTEYDLRRCLGDLGNYMKRYNEDLVKDAEKQKKQIDPKHLMTRVDVIQMLQHLAASADLDDDIMNVLGFCVRHEVTPYNMLAYWEKQINKPDDAPKPLGGKVDKVLDEIAQKEAQEELAKYGNGNGGSMPDDYSDLDHGPCPACGKVGVPHAMDCSIVNARLSR